MIYIFDKSVQKRKIPEIMLILPKEMNTYEKN